MKNIKYFVLLVALTLSGCYKGEIDEINREIESLKNTQIASLESQISAVTKSLSELTELSAEITEAVAKLEASSKILQENIKAVDAKITEVRTSLGSEITSNQADVLSKLSSAKAALESQLAMVEAAKDLLKQKYDSLLANMSNLESYANGTFATTSWLNGTFATVESQNAIISDIEKIKVQLSNISTSTVKVKDEIIQLIRSLGNESVQYFTADIADKVTAIRQEFEAALEKATQDIEAVFSDELKKAIAANEESIKTWVSRELTENYYTVASAEAQIEVFKNMLGSVPAGQTLQGEITALSAAIKTAKSEITIEYGKVITESITKSEGTISKELAQSVANLTSEVINPLKKNIETLETDVDSLISQLSSLTERVNTLDQQVVAANKSLEALAAARKTLDDYAKTMKAKLEKDDADNYAAIKKLIDALEARLTTGDNSLQKQMESLQEYIGTIPSGETSVVTWVEKTKGLIDQQFALLGTLAYFDAEVKKIDDLLAKHDEDIAAARERVENINKKAQSTVEGWVDDQLKDYYTGAKMRDTLEALETAYRSAIGTADAKLIEKVGEVKQTVDKKAGELRTAYKNAITEAITANGGYVTATIKTALETADEDIKQLWDRLNNDSTGVIKKISGILADIETLNTSLGTIDTEVKKLVSFIKGTGYESLKEITTHLKSEVDTLDKKFATIEGLNNLKKLVYGNGGTAEAPTEGSILYQVNQIRTLADDISEAEGMLNTLNTCLKDIDLTSENAKTLKTKITEIETSLNKLKTTVTGAGGLKEQLASIKTEIYGTGSTPETATSGSVFYRLNEMSKMLSASASSFASIAYIPEYRDGMAALIPNGNEFNVSFNFLVRPAGLAKVMASLLKNSGNGGMKFISTPKKAVTYNDFKSVSYSANDDGYLTADATIGSEYKSVAQNGVSAILFVNSEYQGKIYDFASDFIPMAELDDAEGFYLDPKDLTFDGAGSTEQFKAYYSTWRLKNIRVISNPDWITVGTPTQSSGYWTFSVSAGKNTTGSFRFGEAVVEYSYGLVGSTRTISLPVYQEAYQQKLGFDPTSLTFAFNGYVFGQDGKLTSGKTGVVSVNIEGDEGSEGWEAVSQADWITVEKSGKTFKVTTSKNTGTEQREGNIRITSSTGSVYNYTVYQKAREAQTLTFSPESITLGYPKDDSAVLTVSSSDFETDWTVGDISYVGEQTGWLSCARDATDKSKITFTTTAENLAEGGRSCTVKFTSYSGAEYDYSVTQSGRAAQKLEFKPASITLEYPKGETGSVTVTADDGKNDWSCNVPEAASSWLKAEKSDNVVTFTTLADFESDTEETRSAQVIFKTKAGAEYQYSVTQKRRPMETLSFNPESPMTLGFATDLSKTVKVTSSQSRTEWVSTIADDAEWLEVSYVVNSDKTVTLTMTAQPNETTEQRSCNVTMSSYHNSTAYTYVVNQLPKTPQEIKSVTPDPLVLDCLADSQGTATVETTDDNNPAQELGYSCTWFKSASISGKTATFVANENTTTSERSCTITYKSTSGDTKTATVTQRGRQVLTGIPATVTLASHELDDCHKSAQISVSTSYAADWKYEIKDSWLKCTSGTPASSGSTLTFTADDNNEKSSRTTKITFTGHGGETYVCEVTQSPAQTLTLDKTELSLEAAAGSSGTVKVTSSPSEKWTYEIPSAATSWLGASPASSDVSKGGSTITFTTKTQNITGEDLSCDVVFKDHRGNAQTVKVTQKRSAPTISINPTSLTISADGKKYLNGDSWVNLAGSTPMEVALVGGTNWSISSQPGWCHFSQNGSKVAGANAGSVTSWLSSKRSGNLVVAAEKVGDTQNTATCKITQNRPLTVTGGYVSSDYERKSSLSVTFKISSDCGWTVKGVNQYSKIDITKSFPFNKTDQVQDGVLNVDPCVDKEVTVKFDNDNYPDITITNTELGKSYKITTSRDRRWFGRPNYEYRYKWTVIVNEVK